MSAQIRRVAILFCIIAAGMVFTSQAETEWTVDSIAAMLPAQPAGFGRPISDRAAWDGFALTPDGKNAVAKAEKLLSEPIPDQPDDLFLEYSINGNRSRWDAVSRNRRRRVSAFAIAECLENKGRFIAPLQEIVKILCAERTWVASAHDKNLDNFYGREINIDLVSSALAMDMATARCLLGEKLDDAISNLIRDNVMNKVLTPYRDMVSGRRKKDWWITTQNNWNAVCHAGVACSALALLESPQERALYIAAAIENSEHFLNGFTSDGYCSEGVGYWNYGFGNYILLAEAIEQATGGKIKLLDEPKVRPIALYGYHIEIINNIYPPFADCHPGAKASPRLLSYLSRRLGLGMAAHEKYNFAGLGDLSAESLLFTFPSSASDKQPAAKASSGIGIRSLFDEAGVAVCRPTPDTSVQGRLAVALKGGHNAEFHNHNDVGSFSLVLNDKALISDPGSEIYTARTFGKNRYDSKVLNSYGHPVPLVAGKMQKTGRKARARVLESDFTDVADTWVLDLRSAYDLPSLQKLNRTFIFSRKDAGSLTITDEAEFETPQSFGTALITFYKVDIFTSDTLVIGDGREAVKVQINSNGAKFNINTEEIKENLPSRKYPIRIGINAANTAKRFNFTIVVAPISDVKGGK